MDPTANPCEDFWQYACGGWLESEAAVIPSTSSKASRFYQGGELGARNNAVLLSLLDDAAADEGDGDNALGIVYAACLDVDAIETRGAGVLNSLLGVIAALGSGEEGGGDGSASSSELMATLSQLQSVHANAFFFLVIGNDLSDPTQWLLQVMQTGLGLPGPSYYSTEADQDLLSDYQDHIAAMLGLLPPQPDTTLDLAQAALEVLEMEKILASAMEPQPPYSALKVPAAFHKTTQADLDASYPNSSWPALFVNLKLDTDLPLNLGQPSYFSMLEEYWPMILSTSEGVEKVQWYLRWILVHSLVDALGNDFLDEHHQFVSDNFRPPPPFIACCVSLILDLYWFLLLILFLLLFYCPVWTVWCQTGGSTRPLVT